MDQQAKALVRHGLMHPAKSLGGGPLQIGGRALIERDAHEVVGTGIADVKPDARVDPRQVNEVCRKMRLGLDRRRRGQGPLAQGHRIGADGPVDRRLGLGAEVVEGQPGSVQTDRALLQGHRPAARDSVATAAQRRQPRHGLVLAEEVQRAVPLEHGDRRGSVAILSDRRPLGPGLGEGGRSGEAGGGDGQEGSSNQTVHRRLLGAISSSG